MSRLSKLCVMAATSELPKTRGRPRDREGFRCLFSGVALKEANWSYHSRDMYYRIRAASIWRPDLLSQQKFLETANMLCRPAFYGLRGLQKVAFRGLVSAVFFSQKNTARLRCMARLAERHLMHVVVKSIARIL